MGMVFGRIAEEMPKYSIVHTAANYTVRRYEPSIVAICRYGPGGWGSSSDGGPFGQLARFIGVFGKAENEGAQSIPMTAPVLINAAQPIPMTSPVVIDPSSATHEMMFFLPASRYSSLDEVPRPLNGNLRLENIPERLVATRTFSGSLRPAAAQHNLQELLSDLKTDGWKTVATPDGTPDWRVAGYNAPFVLPWFKRNEVMVNLTERAE